MSAILRSNLLLQVLSFIFVPILTRVYGPEQYGLFALFIALSGYFTQLAILRYDVAIDLPEDDHDALPLLHLCFVLTAVAAVMALLLALFSGDWLGRMMGNADLADLLVYLPLSIGLSSVAALVTAWFSRQRDFQAPANIRLVMGITDGLAKLGLGAAGLLKSGQVLGVLISNSLFLGLALSAAKKRGYGLLRGFSLRRAFAAGWRFRRCW